MGKKLKKVVTTTALLGGAMYAVNKYIDYTAKIHHLTEEKEENYFNWRHGDIFYKKCGTGSPILLVHDLDPIASSYEWTNIIKPLSKKHTVYAIDLLGCGKSDKPATTYINYTYVQMLQEFIQKVIGEKTDIVVTGGSFSFVVMAARMNPDLIGRITAIHPADILENVQTQKKSTDILKTIIEIPILGTFIYNLCTSNARISKIFFEEYTYRPSGVSSKVLDTYYECAHLKGGNGKYLLASKVGKYTNINIIQALKIIKQPITIVCTDSNDAAAQYRKYNDNIKIKFVQKSGTLPQMENPSEIIKIIES